MQTNNIVDMSEYRAMVATLAKPGETILATMTPEKAHLWHMATGIMGELTEALLAYANQDFNNLEEELGDTEFYFEGACQVLMHSVNHTIQSDDYLPWDMVGKSIQEAIIASGEVLDCTKKYIVYNDDSRKDGIIKRLNELRFCLDNIYRSSGVSHNIALWGNQQKLLKGSNARYSDGQYTDKAAQVRADKPTGE
tara:strand:+ start:10269 stop:10853 length:585 start_codon:yes stop_codon:yes gene_type:complete